MRLPLDKLLHFSSEGRAMELGESPEATFLAISACLEIRSPFDGVMEALEVVHVAYARHADAISAAAYELRAAIRPVLDELYAALPPTPQG